MPQEEMQFMQEVKEQMQEREEGQETMPCDMWTMQEFWRIIRWVRRNQTKQKMQRQSWK